MLEFLNVAPKPNNELHAVECHLEMKLSVSIGPERSGEEACRRKEASGFNTPVSKSRLVLLDALDGPRRNAFWLRQGSETRGKLHTDEVTRHQQGAALH